MSPPKCRLLELDAPLRHPELIARVDAIFWQTAACTFPPGAERDAFRERWLGRYLEGGSDVVLVALAEGAGVVGYLVGAVADPALEARFADIDYFRMDFAALTPSFPAHLHLNLDADFRSQGIGTALIEAFAARAKRAGAAGMHAVTGKGLRNVGFYARCGFTERAAAVWNGREIVFLGREL
jgi:GNAT superfamily N-acetyltransferase